MGSAANALEKPWRGRRTAHVVQRHTHISVDREKPNYGIASLLLYIIAGTRSGSNLT
jgi:hypothetical protein